VRGMGGMPVASPSANTAASVQSTPPGAQSSAPRRRCVWKIDPELCTHTRNSLRHKSECPPSTKKSSWTLISVRFKTSHQILAKRAPKPCAGDPRSGRFRCAWILRWQRLAVDFPTVGYGSASRKVKVPEALPPAVVLQVPAQCLHVYGVRRGRHHVSCKVALIGSALVNERNHCTDMYKRCCASTALTSAGSTRTPWIFT